MSLGPQVPGKRGTIRKDVRERGERERETETERE